MGWYRPPRACWAVPPLPAVQGRQARVHLPREVDHREAGACLGTSPGLLLARASAPAQQDRAAACQVKRRRRNHLHARVSARAQQPRCRLPSKEAAARLIVMRSGWISFVIAEVSCPSGLVITLFPGMEFLFFPLLLEGAF